MVHFTSKHQIRVTHVHRSKYGGKPIRPFSTSVLDELERLRCHDEGFSSSPPLQVSLQMDLSTATVSEAEADAQYLKMCMISSA
ncbi:hypothetical protein F2P81_002945 [Scophthalmus maximus]|uniref:Uncharacterized protein n=1 Tax=Scophthalmus maximus TaxID=52904 RepID=A0A6A4TBC2_SCOMX|nr:hypothetical protein F2P81_002945 [Scophthalmus maximus]